MDELANEPRAVVFPVPATGTDGFDQLGDIDAAAQVETGTTLFLGLRRRAVAGQHAVGRLEERVDARFVDLDKRIERYGKRLAVGVGPGVPLAGVGMHGVGNGLLPLC